MAEKILRINGTFVPTTPLPHPPSEIEAEANDWINAGMNYDLAHQVFHDKGLAIEFQKEYRRAVATRAAEIRQHNAKLEA